MMVMASEDTILVCWQDKWSVGESAEDLIWARRASPPGASPTPSPREERRRDEHGPPQTAAATPPVSRRGRNLQADTTPRNPDFTRDPHRRFTGEFLISLTMMLLVMRGVDQMAKLLWPKREKWLRMLRWEITKPFYD
ncbi:hypothetical protein GUJ93_ZPchr0004g39739 [Zizania palustris]|uniref:Uncharacterized protein n=1 Tax=Zizania palustris TaxID=103762 RepID=A0A8J5VZI7_ZIZPA|nr:hypothetical protein GUJ93_ZPchr0004g39739 [Zizania palustris]